MMIGAQKARIGPGVVQANEVLEGGYLYTSP